jgi:hypothetical protein
MTGKGATIIVAVIGAVGVLGAAVLTGLISPKDQAAAIQQTATGVGSVNVGRDAVINNNNIKSANEESAELLQACEKQHGLKTAFEKTDSTETTPAADGAPEKFVEHVDFRSCSWPRTRYADPDGYFEIKVRSDNGPGDSEASGTDEADRITAPCPQLLVTYQFGAMGDYRNLTPFRVNADTVVSVEDAKLWTPPNGNVGETLPFYPDAGEFVVLRSGRYIIANAKCL